MCYEKFKFEHDLILNPSTYKNLTTIITTFTTLGEQIATQNIKEL